MDLADAIESVHLKIGYEFMLARRAQARKKGKIFAANRKRLKMSRKLTRHLLRLSHIPNFPVSN